MPKFQLTKPNLKKLDKRFWLGLPLLLLLLYGTFAQYAAWQAGLLPPAEPVAGIEAAAGFGEPLPEGEVVVVISGSVRNRGYYRLGPEVTLRDFLEFARPLPESDLSQLDLARQPQHGDEYYVAAADEPALAARPWLLNSWQQEEEAPPTEESAAAQQPLNINTATLEELCQLPSIGPSRAQAIIDYRLEHQGFAYKEELLGVKGIGEKIYEQLKDKIEV